MDKDKRRRSGWQLVIVACLAFALAWTGGTGPAYTEEAEEPEATETTYRNSSAPKQALAIELAADYIGASSCLMCHEGYKKGYLSTLHALSLGKRYAPPSQVGCEACHGPGSVHAEMMGDAEDARWPAIVRFAGTKRSYVQFAVCMECHEKDRVVGDWAEGVHSISGVTCTQCHDTHNKTEFPHQTISSQNELCAKCHSHVAQVFKGANHHPLLDEDNTCLQCHNPHSANDALTWEEERWDTCAGCHAAAAGPYIYPHLSGDSDIGDGGCAACHDVHGSANHAMLRISGNGLCMQCHTDRVAHNTGTSCWTAGCHSQVHGSNSNLLLLR